MCGRYLLSLDADSGIAAIIARAREKGYDVKDGEIFPTDFVAVTVAANDKPNGATTTGMRWAFTPTGEKKKPLINARAETVLTLPTFREHFPRTRCVFPTTGFYEWDRSRGKAKTLFRLPDTNQLYLAGFYRLWQGQYECIILTTAATPAFEPIHNRMPLILRPDEIRRYLHDAAFAQEILTREPPDLVGEEVSLSL